MIHLSQLTACQPRRLSAAKTAPAGPITAPQLPGLLWAKLKAICIWDWVAQPCQRALSQVISGSALASYVGSDFGSSDNMYSIVLYLPRGAPKMEKACQLRGWDPVDAHPVRDSRYAPRTV